MKYHIIISERAKEMLGMHIRFLAQVNKAAASKLKNRLVTEIRSLQTMPQRFPFFNEDYIPANKYHKLYVENWYLVLYQIKDDTVYVDWILDCRQDYPWLLR
jgi:plasmid stabilization system protein ParE